MRISSLRKTQHKKRKIKPKQNFSGQASFFQHNLNSGCKHVTDDKLQVFYRECHLPCIRSFHRLFIHFEAIFISRCSQFTHPYFVKLSVSFLNKFCKFLESFLPFNLFLLLKTLRLSEYLTNFTIMVRRLFSVFAPIR